MRYFRNMLAAVAALLCIQTWALGQSTNYSLANIAALRTTDLSATGDGYVNVAGFGNAGDGGGGQFYRGAACTSTMTATVSAFQLNLVTVSSTATLQSGMGVNGTVLPGGDTILAINSATQFTLATAATSSGSGFTFTFGGNGGTVFMDGHAPTPDCFYRQNYTGDVRQFGAKCDVLQTVLDGSVSSGSTSFTSALVTFTSNDIGKTIQLNYGKGANPPFRTTISAVSGNTATLAAAAPAAYPGHVSATDANMNLPVNGGGDNPGTGWEPGFTASDSGGGAAVSVYRTGLVNLTINSAGSNYQANDILTGTGTGGQQKAPAQIQVMSVNGSGAITAANIIYNGLWGGANPSSFAWSGGHGTGFSNTLARNAGSFGVTAVLLTAGGSYSGSGIPNAPVSMTGNTCYAGLVYCTGLTVDLAFSRPDWSYGSDDTVALQNIENYAETTAFNTTMRGLSGAVKIPQGMCYASGLVINRTVTWSGAGAKQSRLVQLLGSPGNSINGSTPAFVTAAVAYPGQDDYEQEGYAQPQVSFENLALWGSSPSTTADIGGGTPSTNGSAGLVVANPVANQAKAVPLYLDNVEIQGFPNYLLSAKSWDGDMRGYQVNLFNAGQTLPAISGVSTTMGTATVTLPTTVGLFAGMSVTSDTTGQLPPYDTIATVVSSTQITLAQAPLATTTGDFTFASGNCLDMDHVANPTKFFGLVTAHCNNYALHINKGSEYEFHGWVGYSNSINLVLTGQSQVGSTITFYGGQFTDTQLENAYFDQQNEAVICYMCNFFNSNQGGATSGDADADIVIGPDAGSANPYPVLQLSAPQFGREFTDKNILFDQNASMSYCTCRVNIDGLSVDRSYHGNAVPTTNNPALLASGYLYAPLQFATGDGSAVSTSAPANAIFNMTFGSPSRLYSYVTASNGHNLVATPPGGSGNWNVSIAYDLWDIERSGPSAGFTDYWDTASNIIAAINNGGSYVTAGQRYNVVICNAGGGTEMLATNAGLTLAGTMTVAAGACGKFAILVNAGATTLTIIGSS